MTRDSALSEAGPEEKARGRWKVYQTGAGLGFVGVLATDRQQETLLRESDSSFHAAFWVEELQPYVCADWPLHDVETFFHALTLMRVSSM